uniref:Poly [ADP-ribose] polymerase n=1 Tax=Oryza punctata TaxID=4537 RepID=A0A0E0JI89_ORYPU
MWTAAGRRLHQHRDLHAIWILGTAHRRCCTRPVGGLDCSIPICNAPAKRPGHLHTPCWDVLPSIESFACTKEHLSMVVVASAILKAQSTSPSSILHSLPEEEGVGAMRRGCARVEELMQRRALDLDASGNKPALMTPSLSPPQRVRRLHPAAVTDGGDQDKMKSAKGFCPPDLRRGRVPHPPRVRPLAHLHGPVGCRPAVDHGRPRDYSTLAAGVVSAIGEDYSFWLSHGGGGQRIPCFGDEPAGSRTAAARHAGGSPWWMRRTPRLGSSSGSPSPRPRS